MLDFFLFRVKDVYKGKVKKLWITSYNHKKEILSIHQ